MVKKIKQTLKKLTIGRTTILAVFFIILSFILVQRLFHLQIVEGENYANNFNLRTTKERSLKSTRGIIYDRNGNVLAKNELSYSLTLEDNGTYQTTRDKNLSLNSEALRICQLLEDNGDSIDIDFHIIIDEQGEYAFDVEGVSLDRFRADVYGRKLVKDLKKDEANADANAIMDSLCSANRFGLVNEKEPYSEKELSLYNLPKSLSKEETLKIVKIRYALFSTSFAKYKPKTIATDISESSVAALMENKDSLMGIEIEEDSRRVYEDSIYFASILGYTGKASAEELADLQDDYPDSEYSSGSIIGKAGIEQVMETTLQGKNGKELVNVDNMGKVLQIEDDSRKEPIAGNDVYLTIDKELQIATYKILEQKIAGILVTNIINAKEFDKTEVESTDQIRIPIYDVYNALISNSVIDIDHFTADDASSVEQTIYSKFTQKQETIFSRISSELTGASPVPYKDLDKEMKEYMSYIVNDLLMEKTNILNETSIDKSDDIYIAWTKDEAISLQEYLTYAASQNWIDISSISTEDTYLDSKEVYKTLATYINEYLSNDKTFSKLLYKYMIKNDVISGYDICQVLYNQEVLDKNDTSYDNFISGSLSPYDLMVAKISALEITPAQLALDPHSGSAVVTDPKTGEILACVTYPSYDNNRLANQMDTAYYKQLSADQSQPFYNKATQERTAPGSTFKLVTTVAGLSEGVITSDTTFNCTGVFDLTETPLKCSNRDGHGELNVVPAIQNSCNVFFNNVAFKLGLDEDGKFSDTLALQKLTNYTNLFDMDKKSGIEIPEVAPQVSDFSAIQSSIGQGRHNYTTSQLARYVTTLANKGTSYEISLIDKVSDSDGVLIEDYSPKISSKLSLPDETWNDIHAGMRAVISSNGLFNAFGIDVSGKTGTAQQSNTRPNHGLFIGYAPSDDPSIAVAIRIAFGYSSTNAVAVAKDIISYQFDLSDESDILTGNAEVDDISNVRTD